MRELTYDPALFDDGFFKPEPSDPVDLARAERVKDAVEALPEPQRTIVECIVWGQMTKTQVAEIVGRPRQSVHDLFVRALDTLREVLRDEV